MIKIIVENLENTESGALCRLIAYLEGELAARSNTEVHIQPIIPIATDDDGCLAKMTDDEALAILAGTNNLTSETDSEGLPWDARIHASTKGKLANGTWRTKKGVDPRLVEDVTAELRAVAAIPSPAGPTSDLTQVFGGGANVPLPQSTGTAGADAASLVDSSNGVNTQSATVTNLTFAQFLRMISVAVAEQRLTQTQVTEAITAIGLPALPMLAQRTDLIPSVVKSLGLENELTA